MNIATQVSTPRPSRTQTADHRSRAGSSALDALKPHAGGSRSLTPRLLSWLGLALLWALATALLVLGVEFVGALAG